MEASTNQNKIVTAKSKINNKFFEFTGKLSFTFNTLKVILTLSFAETPYIRDIDNKIQDINSLFTKYEDKDINETLLKFLLIDLISPLQKKLPKNEFGLKALIEFSKYLNNKIKFEQFFENLINLLNEAISLVQKNGSKSSSMKIINDFYDYLNKYSEKLDKLKMASFSKKLEVEEKINSTSNYKNIIQQLNDNIKVLKNELKQKDKELEELNAIILQANLDKESYIGINNSLEKKIKEMEKKFELMFEKKDKEIKNLNNKIDIQNNIIVKLQKDIESDKLNIKILEEQNNNTMLENKYNKIENSNNKINIQNNTIINMQKENESDRYYIKIKEQHDTMFGKKDKEIENLNNIIDIQNNIIAYMKKDIESNRQNIQKLQEQNETLFKMINQDRKWVRTLRDSLNQLDDDYN